MSFSKNTEQVEEVQVEDNTSPQDVSFETSSRTQKWGLVKPSVSAWSLVKPSPYSWSSVKPTTVHAWSSVKPTTVAGWNSLKTVAVSQGADNVKGNQVVPRKRSFDSCTGLTSANNQIRKKPRFTLEDRRQAIVTMKDNPKSCSADHYMLGETESGVKFEREKERVVVHTTLRPKDFRSYICAPLTHGLFDNQTKDSHFRNIKNYLTQERLVIYICCH